LAYWFLNPDTTGRLARRRAGPSSVPAAQEPNPYLDDMFAPGPEARSASLGRSAEPDAVPVSTESGPEPYAGVATSSAVVCSAPQGQNISTLVATPLYSNHTAHLFDGNPPTNSNPFRDPSALPVQEYHLLIAQDWVQSSNSTILGSSSSYSPRRCSAIPSSYSGVSGCHGTNGLQ